MLPDGAIDKFLARRVCARCYGEMRREPAENRNGIAVCPACGNAWGGATISRHTAERRGQKGLADLWEVKYNLRDLFPPVKRGEKQTLKELGF